MSVERADQFIGNTLLSSTAITSYVSSRIYNGSRPADTTIPSINFYEIVALPKRRAVQAETYSINCRASSQGSAKTLGSMVSELFGSASGDGTLGSISAFSCITNVIRENCLEEVDLEFPCWNYSVDVQIVHL